MQFVVNIKMITINLQKKYLILFISAIILFAGIFLVIAYNSGGPPAYMGHSAEEIYNLHLDCTNVINDTLVESGNICTGTATCPSEYILTDGGCRTQMSVTGRNVYRMFPINQVTWYCAQHYDGGGRCGEAYARCCKPAAGLV